MMTKRTKDSAAIEFGDFQTPPDLAAESLRTLTRLVRPPRSIVEPTCGRGSFLAAAVEAYAGVERVFGLELNAGYAGEARARLRQLGGENRWEVVPGDFFTFDWRRKLAELPEPLLVVGNPPWVTNSAQGAMGGSNLPAKANTRKLAGLDALTGKSNFDISEWILTRLVDLLAGREATLAMLCKTAVARKVLRHAWTQGIGIKSAQLFQIDAAKHFGASVEACLFVCQLSPGGSSRECQVHEGLDSLHPARVLGFHDGRLIADVKCYEKWKHLEGASPFFAWRSGIKHDCARVMELSREGTGYRNGLGEAVAIEEELVFPLLKSSDLANGRVDDPRRHVIVTQRKIGEETGRLATQAPRTWAYLKRHQDLLDRRKSAIYRGRPPFSIFGVGEYSFKPWKVAVSGFYRGLSFKLVGPCQGKPCMLDDTVYFLSFDREAEARLVAELLNSTPAQEFYAAFLFRDAKRPVTTELLKRLDLRALARELGMAERLETLGRECDLSGEIHDVSSRPRRSIIQAKRAE